MYFLDINSLLDILFANIPSHLVDCSFLFMAFFVVESFWSDVVLPHIHQNGCYQKNKEQVLVGMWRENGTLHALLVGM